MEGTEQADSESAEQEAQSTAVAQDPAVGEAQARGKALEREMDAQADPTQD